MLVLGRVNDSSESDSSLFACFAGEREDSSKMFFKEKVIKNGVISPKCGSK
jgi:hypothetical protein